jgi:uncharacterized membrane-anchored protein YjiN (DUF445 family)
MNSSSIVNGLSEFKEDSFLQKSLLEKIEEATCNEEIQELLKIGSTYKKASTKTLKMWAKAAALKSEQFKSK